MSTPGVGIRCERKTCRKDGAKSDKRERDQYALVYETFDNIQRHENPVLSVNSPIILKAFCNVIGVDANHLSQFQEPFELCSPFELLHHHWEKLEEYHRLATDDDVRAHLQLLLEFMNTELGVERQRIRSVTQQHQISFEHLWSLFAPGEELYHSDGDHPWLLRCSKTTYQDDPVGGPVCIVSARFTDSSGELEGDTELRTVIQRKIFDQNGLIDIAELPIYPLTFWNGDYVSLRKRLEARGSKYLAINRDVQFKYYDGEAKYLQTSSDGALRPISDAHWQPFLETGRIILDRRTFDKEVVFKTPVIKSSGEADPLLCPPFVVGYSPNKKAWCRYYLDNLSDIEWKESPWDSLLIPDRHKRTLKALVGSHVSPENFHDDTEQKGKGLIILLHGSHGTGKTLTAETAAEGAKKVIIPLSPGDLNQNDSLATFEQHLKQIFQHATKWGAILLLDNADTFLPQHHADLPAPNPHHPTALIRLLEHFSGTIFLTTSRLSALSTSLTSHIHLALAYDTPGPEPRRQLWLLFLSLIPEAELDMSPDKDVDRWHLMAEKLNGREIAHAICTARTLARAEGVPLQLDHLLTVLGMRREFESSVVREARGGEGLTSPTPGDGGTWKEGILPSPNWIPASISSLPRLAVAKARNPF